MVPTKLDIGILIIAVGIGLFGNLYSSYTWWLIVNDKKTPKYLISLFGTTITLMFIILILLIFFLYLSII